MSTVRSESARTGRSRGARPQAGQIRGPPPSPPAVAPVVDDELDWSPTPDGDATPFTNDVDRLLQLTAQIARRLVPAHQAAAALIVKEEWQDMRKYFSLSPKYAEWLTYRTPAVGHGIHAKVVEANSAIRLSQAQLERHPDFKSFGREAGKHPPMRGWLAVPIIGHDGENYGLLQLSDRADGGDFTEADELQLARLARMTALGLGALCHQYHRHDHRPR